MFSKEPVNELKTTLYKIYIFAMMSVVFLSLLWAVFSVGATLGYFKELQKRS